MNLTLRIFLAYFLLVGAGLVMFLYSTYDELRPVIRQSSETTLVDTANLLAEFAPPLLVPQAGSAATFTQAVHHYEKRELDADIWSHHKTAPSFRIYVTDQQGKVVFDTEPGQIGQDYSGWIDVSRTLKGEYGARTTPVAAVDDIQTTMYVAAPVRYQGRLVGVLTVAQPNRSIQPFLAYARQQVLRFNTLILVAALLFGGLLAFWLTRSIRRLVQYVERVRGGENVQPPALREPELARLADATEKMRRELEGKRYVEEYIQHLTHEMKSPLSAIRGAVEILQDGEPDACDRQRFLNNIDWESLRMQQLIERLLALASLENRHGLVKRERIDLDELLREELEHKADFARQHHVHLEVSGGGRLSLWGERLLLRQALGNLIDNALDFCKPDGALTCRIHRQDNQLVVTITNAGDPIPDYALPRLFERFYSLKRPGTGRKSTGLGLSFVREIAQLHGGQIELDNVAGGVQAKLSLPVN